MTLKCNDYIIVFWWTFPSFGLFLHVLALFAHFHIHRCEYDSRHQDQSTGHQVCYGQEVILPTKPGHHWDHQLLLTSKGLDRKIWSYWSRQNLVTGKNKQKQTNVTDKQSPKDIVHPKIKILLSFTYSCCSNPVWLKISSLHIAEKVRNVSVFFFFLVTKTVGYHNNILQNILCSSE